MIESGSSLIKTASVPGVRKSEFLRVEMVTELVQQRVQEAARRRHLPEHGGAHPDPDATGLEVVVAEKLELSRMSNTLK